MRSTIIYGLVVSLSAAFGSAVADQIWHGQIDPVKSLVMGIAVGVSVAAFRHWKDSKSQVADAGS